MKELKVKSTHLAAGLAKVLKAKKANQIIPSLECVHAKTFPGGLILTCTDIETSITTGIAAEVEEAGIEFLIPPQGHTVINLLKDEETDIIISITEKELKFSYGDNVMKFAPEEVAKFVMPKEVKKGVEFEIVDSPALFTIFDDCLKFTSTDDLRPALTGVYFSDKEIAATDAHRLLIANVKCPAKKTFSVILPKTFITALSILDTKTKIKIGDTHISINDSTTQIISRHIDAKFPDYNTVIPKESDYHLTINSAEVKRNIRIASSLTTKDKKIVFRFDKTTYTVKGFDIDLGQEILLNGKCQLAHVEAYEPIQIGFNGAMLTQLLEIAGNTDLTFELQNANRAMMVNVDFYSFLLMPIMIQEPEGQTEEKTASPASKESRQQGNPQIRKTRTAATEEEEIEEEV